MTRYAENTGVSAAASRDEIERILSRYGADAFMYGWEGSQALVQFRAKGRYIRFVLPLPSRDERRFTHHTRGPRAPEQAAKEWEQATRQRWRALALVIKAKLEAVETGIAEFEDEFMANIVLPDGQTVSRFMRPQIALAYERGEMPTMLPQLEGPK